MKTITLWQPWASLVAIGAKKIETRSWATKHRGPLAIHAAKKVDTNVCVKREFVIPLNEHGMVMIKDLPVGAVIATCNLVDCVEIESASLLRRVARLKNGVEISGNEFVVGFYAPGRYAWILEDVKQLDKPVPAVGKQRLWEWDGRLL
ncbi:ASCH domain-containing protein [Desulfotomaculum sp. 1211_IL3151]|uniref:ASCH domain-containing protein n=1 Tax=Desulfotomaculum sp. 1211_IL3151 TaxID=3084055 RepID=UPI002FDA6FDC